MQTYRGTAAAIAVAGLLFAPRARAETLELDLEETKRRVIAESPGSRIAAQEVALAEAALSEARALAPSDPVVGGTLARRDDGDLGEDWSASVSQTLYVPGQRFGHLSAARHRRSAAASALRQALREIGARAGLAFVDALASSDHAKLASEEESLAAELLRAAKARGDAGTAGTLELNLVRLGHVRAVRNRAEADRDALIATSALRVLLALSPTDELRLRRSERSSFPPVPSLAVLLETASKNRGDLAEAEFDERAAGRERLAARLDVIPRPTLTGEIERDDGADVVRVGISIPFPILQRNTRARGEANAQLVQASASRELVRAVVAAEVSAAVGRFDAARRAMAAFDEDAERALVETDAMLEEARSAGKIDFAQRVLLRRDVVEARRARVDAEAELQRARLELERAIGEDLVGRSP